MTLAQPSSRSGVVAARLDDDRVQAADVFGGESDVAQERFGVQFDALPSAPWRSRSVPSWLPPPTKPTQHDAGSSSARTVTHSERSSSCRGHRALVGVVHGLEELVVGQRRRVDVDAERGDVGRRPRLVAVAEHAQRSAAFVDRENEQRRAPAPRRSRGS